jgi:hypothetical protein
VKTFVWILAAGVDGNEFDDFGMLHGLRGLADDFAPRPVFGALQNTNALFADTHLDGGIRIETADWQPTDKGTLLTYGFRNTNGKAIVAYWVAAHSEMGGAFPALTVKLTVRNSGLRNPVLIDISSGEVRPLQWTADGSETLEAVPVRDSVMAIADASYFDWPVLPQAPSGLRASLVGGRVQLKWEMHGSDAMGFALERRRGESNNWERIAKGPAAITQYVDRGPGARVAISYRVRASNAAGDSAFSNIVRVKR